MLAFVGAILQRVLPWRQLVGFRPPNDSARDFDRQRHSLRLYFCNEPQKGLAIRGRPVVTLDFLPNSRRRL